MMQNKQDGGGGARVLDRAIISGGSLWAHDVQGGRGGNICVSFTRRLGFLQAVQHLRNKHLAGAWLRWHEFLGESTAQRSLSEKAVGYWRNRRYGPAFLSWREWCW